MGGVDVKFLRSKEQRVQRKAAVKIRLEKLKLKFLGSLNYNIIIGIYLDLLPGTLTVLYLDNDTCFSHKPEKSHKPRRF